MGGTARERVAANVRRLREDVRGYTQTRLAELAGCDERQIRYIEAGANVTLATLDQLATALRVDVAELLAPVSG